MLVQNQYYSYNLGELPEGCRYCVQGEKLVYFATGLCPRTCYFCPVSDQKYGHDVTFANERKIETQEDLLQEAEQMQARGAGITGGDPLMKIDRTLQSIITLKQKYGKTFHIHLYTSLNLVTEQALQKLYDAGLDEIRFHLDLDSDFFWKKLELAQKFPWQSGVELPVIPAKEAQIKKIIDYIHDKVHFLVLNELEVADNKQSKLLQMGYKTVDTFKYNVEQSLETGKRLLQYAQEKHLPLKVHLCTALLKDKIQLTNRIKRESLGARKKFDLVDEEGLLTRGALYLPELVPGFEYRKKLAAANKEQLLAKFLSIKQTIIEKFHLPENEIFLDEQKLRLLVSAKRAEKKVNYFKKLGLVPAIVIEYPTADQLEMEVTLL